METRQTRENWRPVAGYRGAYEVSDQGRVRKAHSGQIMKPRRDRGGYVRINLTLDKVKTTHKVHRLVAAAFVPGYAEDLQVNHKDANKTNNCADNLEWVTAKGNHDASYNVRMMKAKGTHVTQYKTNGEVVAYFFRIRAAFLEKRLHEIKKSAFFVWSYLFTLYICPRNKQDLLQKQPQR